MVFKAMNRVLTPARDFAVTLMNEKLAPGRAAAAVFIGIFIAHVPIYGFQALTAVGLAVVLGLNKPLTLAATFINNPLLQPLLIALSVQLGQFVLTGRVHRFAWPDMSPEGIKKGFSFWIVGTLSLGLILGAVGSLLTFVALTFRKTDAPATRARVRFVNRLFANCSWFERGFVRWKLRLDRIFGILAAENLGTGTAVDLGCGYGIALAFAAFEKPDRRLVGCDLNPDRIAAARQAFASGNADLRVEDVRGFQLPRADLILILDVLQYLSAADQLGLLARCCSALEPDGRLVFRVHDRNRGLLSALSMIFDRIIFRFGRAGVRPLMLSETEYRIVLESSGVDIDVRRLRNRLPLAHLVFVARKPARKEAKLCLVG
jgi:uncharacterized protein (DUF2062 family)/predicted TPR repeat methyltransferase